MRLFIAGLLLMLLTTATTANAKPTTSSLGMRPSGGRHFGGFHDGFTSGGGFRQRMLEEIRHVPLLEKRLKAMMEIQQERASLQHARDQFARRTEKPSSSQLNEFHDLLRREDLLTSQQEQLISQLLRDADKIQEQIAKRRADITKRQAELKSRPQTPDIGGELRLLERSAGLYQFLDDKIDDLRENPQQQTDLLRRLTKGMWFVGEADPHMTEQVRRRLQQVQEDQDSLRHRMDEIDGQINELKELLDLMNRPNQRSHGERGQETKPQRR